jgi:hypothetical protein
VDEEIGDKLPRSVKIVRKCAHETLGGGQEPGLGMADFLTTIKQDAHSEVRTQENCN